MTQRFEGVIGRDWRDSTPWWPPEPAPPDERAQRPAHRARRRRATRSSAATAPTSPRRSSTGSRPTACASRTSTPPRSAPRPVRACSPAATITATAWAASPTSRSGYPGYWGMIPRENGFLPEILRAHGYATYAVGKWHLTPDDEVNMAASRASWPLGRGFDRWYGFHGGETHQFAPSLYHDNHAVLAARATTRAATTSAPTSPTGRSSSSPTCARSTTNSRSSATSRPARATRRTTRRPSGSRATRATSTRAGTRGARPTFARQLESGLLPPGTQLSPRPPWVPAWDDLAPEDQAVAARFMECFAAYLSYTDAQIGARARRTSSETGDLDNTLIVARAPTTARAPRAARAARSTTCACATARSTGRKELRARIDEIGGPTDAQQLPVGLDDGRQHAVQALEARGARGRRRRSVHRPAARAPRAPSGGTVRHQFAHAIDVLPDRARARRHRRARRRSTASRSRTSTARASLYALRRRRRARAPRDAVLRDARLARRSTTRAGRR